MSDHRLNHLESLEAESVHILREVVAEFERPVLLYSVGKDSSVLLRLCQKALAPGPIPFPPPPTAPPTAPPKRDTADGAFDGMRRLRRGLRRAPFARRAVRWQRHADGPR